MTDKFIVASVYGRMDFVQCAGQFFRHVDRSMLATGAAQCHGQIATIDADVLGNPCLKKIQNIFIHPHKGVFCIKKFGHFLVQPVKTAQLGLPIGVWQTTQIENEIRICRNAMLETERLQQDGQTPGFSPDRPFPE